jgi:DegV family protein with EDD domain
MPGVRIVTDSSCDLPQALCDQYGITVVPLTIRFGTEEFVDRVDLTPTQFWERCASSPVLPETAAPAPGAFDAAFRAAAADGADGVVCVNISSKLSATSQSAEAAALLLSNTIPVQVIDSESVTMGLGMIVLHAARRAESGGDLDDVVASTQGAVGRCRVFGTLDTLENLKKGGRIGGAKALLGSLLSIKPVVVVENGKVEEGAKQRTRSRALRYLVERITSEPGKIEHLAVMNGAAPDVGVFLDLLAAHFPREQIVVADLGAVIGAHTGIGTIGIAYLVA